MSFDKVKAMRNAERFLSQGKLRSAIGEYKRIVENDPRDYNTLNILGDLYVKNSESDEAVSCYMKVADYYNKQGFTQKAIAVYNKITRIKPHSADVSEKLAKLYQMKGSFAEARSHYVALAEQYQRKGQKSEALEIWKQIAQLDPNNTEVYLKIAETCWQEGNKEEAAKAFIEAGNRLAKLNQLESSLTAFSRSLEIRPFDLHALEGFVNVQVKLGFADDAAHKLESILEKQPYNREILFLLVDCHLDANNPSQAEKALIRLVEQEPANYPKFLQLVEVYVKMNDLESAVRILSMSSEHLLVGGKSDDFLKWTNEILARNPEQLDGLRLLVRHYGWQKDESELKKALERLAEIARLQNAVEDERYALSQLVMILPHEISYAKRLQEIRSEFGDGEHEFSQSETIYQNVEVEEVAEFSDYTVLEDGRTDSNADFAEDYSQYTNGNNISEEADAFVYAESAINESSNGYDNYSFVSNDYVTESVASNNLKPADEMRVEQELESIRFYLSQGYAELAGKTLDVLETEFGQRPEFAEIRKELASSATEDEQKNSVEAKEFVFENFSPAVEETKTEALTSSSNAGFFDDFRSDLGLEESVSETDEGDYETHYHLAIAYKEMGLMEESIREFQEAVNMVRADDGTRRFFQCCNLLGHCFMEQGMPNLALIWYRRALETPNLNDEEKQALLYETASAYELGGEKPKAVEYLEQIYAINVDYRDVSSRLEQLRDHNFAM